MADLDFSQPERRSFAIPLLIALLVLAGVGFAIFSLSPRTIADVAIPRVEVFSSHVVFGGPSRQEGIRVLGPQQAEDVLYILAVVRITDRLRLPLFLKDINATLIPNDGSLQPATSAVESSDLNNVFTSFPALRSLAQSLGVPPLAREIKIDPGQTAQGYVLLHFPVTREQWEGRNDGVLTLDLYHQGPLSVSIPKSATPAPAQPAATPSAPQHP